jgi:hypothetical protein
LAAANILRREGYDRAVTIFSADDSPPCDRPNLSKDFLAGTAQEEWIPLRSPEYYTDRQIKLVLATRVAAIDVKEKQLQLEDGKTSQFGALLIATGADPVRLKIEGVADSQILYLRTFADSKAIIWDDKKEITQLPKKDPPRVRKTRSAACKSMPSISTRSTGPSPTRTSKRAGPLWPTCSAKAKSAGSASQTSPSPRWSAS